MLKIIGAVLVIFACAALGYKKSAAISDRLFLLACIFRENAEKYLKNSELTQKDFEEFVQLGEYLGYLDTDMQKNTTQWYLQQLKTEIDILAGEIPVKKKLYRSLGVLSGIFLAILLL